MYFKLNQNSAILNVRNLGSFGVSILARERPVQFEGQVHLASRELIPRLSDSRLIFAPSQFRAQPDRVLGSRVS